MHAISSYRDNRPTNTQNRQGQLQYTALLSLERSVKIYKMERNNAGEHEKLKKQPKVYEGSPLTVCLPVHHISSTFALMFNLYSFLHLP